MGKNAVFSILGWLVGIARIFESEPNGYGSKWLIPKIMMVS